MYKGDLTPKEADIIRLLLDKHGIFQYEIVGAVGEGKSLSGSTYPTEVESLSGIVVTPTTAFSFWFDWSGDDYTLGEHDGTWRELTPDQIISDDEILKAQMRLRQNEASLSESSTSELNK